MRDLLIDSFVLIEYFRGNEWVVGLIEQFEESDDVFYINEVVFSEVVYIFLGYFLGVFFWMIKGYFERLFKELFIVFKVLEDFGFIFMIQNVFFKVCELIEKYVFFFNDVFIFVICIEYGFFLVMIDDDFKVLVEKEKVEIIGGQL